ncbi:MAG: PhoX family phosphatase, partial [Mesorhizobium sp.]
AEGSAFKFDELEAGIDDKHHVAPGYDADVLLRWGDPLFADSPAFDPLKQSAEAQAKQFGYNNDYVGYIPIDGSAEHGLLVVNHEYTNPHLMFPGIVSIVEKDGKKAAEVAPLSKEQVDVEMAAHGGTIVEIRKQGGKWQVVRDGKLNRRIMSTTEMALSGPAAGHDRLKTNADPSGAKVIGTLNNCAGGVTPWGTYVMAEENIHGYFSGELPEGHREAANYKRLGIPEGAYEWGAHYDRFNLAKEPNEPNRFGWIVEVDVNDPNSVPRKRTAMGRFKHEGAESIVARDGRVVFYLGDDERFDYVYKFVTAGRFNPDDRAANMNLLDDGTLHVAKFAEDGSVEWMPVVFGQGPLTAENGLASQADVLIETRRAADLLSATKMDRPEDIQPNAGNGKVYVMLTNNSKRKAEQVDAANPRAANAFGHIIEIVEDGGDFAATKGKWEVLLKCGDPSVADVGATFSTATTAHGWFGMPDNCAVDSAGRLWVATDGQGPKATGRTDGLWAVDTEG